MSRPTVSHLVSLTGIVVAASVAVAFLAQAADAAALLAEAQCEGPVRTHRDPAAGATVRACRVEGPEVEVKRRKQNGSGD